jgi:hypothetical protein
MARRRGVRRRRRPFFYVINARVLIFGILLAAILIGSGAFSRALETVRPAGPLLGQVIYIDPGHGGIDPGACGATVLRRTWSFKSRFISA